MSPVVIMAAATVVGQALAVLALWLRLRSQLEQEQAHRRLLVDLLQELQPGAHVHDRRPDGASLTLTLPASPSGQGDARG